MKPVVTNGQCRLIGHCTTCRADVRWRKIVSAPDICPHGIGTRIGLGDVVAMIATPIASALRLDCIDYDGTLKPKSKCAERRDALNKLTQ